MLRKDKCRLKTRMQRTARQRLGFMLGFSGADSLNRAVRPPAGPLDALRSRAYCVASKCKYESGSHHRILHGLKLRTEGRQFGGENPDVETANRFVETHSVRRWRL